MENTCVPLTCPRLWFLDAVLTAAFAHSCGTEGSFRFSAEVLKPRFTTMATESPVKSFKPHHLGPRTPVTLEPWKMGMVWGGLRAPRWVHVKANQTLKDHSLAGEKPATSLTGEHSCGRIYPTEFSFAFMMSTTGSLDSGLRLISSNGEGETRIRSLYSGL